MGAADMLQMEAPFPAQSRLEVATTLPKGWAGEGGCEAADDALPTSATILSEPSTARFSEVPPVALQSGVKRQRDSRLTARTSAARVTALVAAEAMQDADDYYSDDTGDAALGDGLGADKARGFISNRLRFRFRFRFSRPSRVAYLRACRP